MNAAPDTRLLRLPVRERLAHATFRPVVALMIVAAVAASPQGEAADRGLSVASHIPAAATGAARPSP